MRSFYGGGECPISTVAFPWEEEGRTAAKLLLEVVAKPDMAPRTIYLPTKIIRRQTTK